VPDKPSANANALVFRHHRQGARMCIIGESGSL
jgi:hypothetical protein